MAHNGERQLTTRKNDKNGEWMLDGQAAINGHLPIFAFVGQVTRLGDCQQEHSMKEKISLSKTTEAEGGG